MSRPLLVIVGPTCTGKTALAVALAGALAPAELMNADSRQIRRGLRVGTCAPAPEELGAVRCNLLDLCDPGDIFTVADWVAEARRCVARLERAATWAVVVGGTGLYVTALVDGLDLGGVPADLEQRARREELTGTPSGFTRLVSELRRRDPAGAATIDLRNPRRVVRALEILDARGGSLLDARGAASAPSAVMVGLDVARPLHAGWVERRADAMFRDGAIQAEVGAMLARGVSRAALGACGIGYAEAIDLLDGRLDQQAAVAGTITRTLRYARAQRTWFRRDPRIVWMRPDETGFDQLVGDAVALAHTVA